MLSASSNEITGWSVNDPFWNRFRECVVREGIPYQWAALNDALPEDTEPSHCLRNFRIAAGKEQGTHQGFVFQDSDLYKWLEGVAYSLRWHPDPQLEALADSAIEEIRDAQQPDGYLNTYYTINGLDKRWTNLQDHHELYCAGHLIEAAVAYYQATGKRMLLDIALRFVEHISTVLGPEPGKIHAYPGHPVIEMALVRLYEVTKDERHLQLSGYFIDQRGQAPLYFQEEAQRGGWTNYWSGGPLGWRYYQAQEPVREQADAVGHAVRAVYLYSGMADVARETEDSSLAEACRRLWKSITGKRMYITGAIGSSEYGEAFTFDYDLPNDTIYGETCASIGLVFFARRMLGLEKRGEYADVMERALYNGVISGMQLDGKRFFYVNPLEVDPEACRYDYNKRHVKAERQKWFGCACCPPNIIRLLTSLEDYVCTAAEDTLYMHLYMGGEVHSGPLSLRTETDYPWSGNVKMTVLEDAAEGAVLALRIPGWCRSWTLQVNGEEIHAQPSDGYVYLKRGWQQGDQISLNLDMPVRMVYANPAVREDAGKAALMRGPLVYCLEEADNGADLHALRHAPAIRAEAVFETLGTATEHVTEQAGGIVALYTDGLREDRDAWGTELYAEKVPEDQAVRLRWIPYYAWANRGSGEMTVWVRYR
ncbi:MAG: glycoside hydrolase family 127 protein [Blautia sp.]|nr:glycoside hydrolase family 127 protein [Blautia sp.]